MGSRKAVGSLIGIGFLLMILALGFSYNSLISRVEDRTDDTLSYVFSLDRDAADESIEYQSIELTVGNSLNLTLKNTGNIFAELEWIGVFDDTLNTQNYYRVDTAINPLETRKDVGNSSIVMNPANEYTIQVVTRLGNLYYGNYPFTTETESESVYYYVQSTGDDNLPAELGTASLFNAMQDGPDHVNNTYTEEEIIIVATNSTLINAESFEGIWPPTDWDASGVWNQESDVVYDGTFSADFDGSNAGGGQTGYLDTPSLDCSDANVIYLDFWFYDDNLDGNEFEIQYYDGTNWDTIDIIGNTFTEDTWHNYQAKIVDPQYFINGFRVSWAALDVENNEHAYVDLVTIKKETGGANYYDLDIEGSWTDLPSRTNEYLIINGGVQGTEAMRVDYWNGATWVNLVTDLTPEFNVVDISGVLTGSSFTIRFTDTTGIGDLVQDSWDIDAVYLHLFD